MHDLRAICKLMRPATQATVGRWHRRHHLIRLWSTRKMRKWKRSPGTSSLPAQPEPQMSSARVTQGHEGTTRRSTDRFKLFHEFSVLSEDFLTNQFSTCLPFNVGLIIHASTTVRQAQQQTAACITAQHSTERVAQTNRFGVLQYPSIATQCKRFAS